MPTRSPFSFKI